MKKVISLSDEPTQVKRQFQGKLMTKPKHLKPIGTSRGGRPVEHERIQAEYNSMDQCSEHTHIPKSVLKLASKKGCVAFHHSRINTLELIRWLFDREASETEDSGINWGDALNKEKTLRERGRRKKEEGATLDAADVAFANSQAVSLFFTAIDRSWDVDLPAMLVGLDAIGIQAKGREEKEKWKQILRDGLAQLEKSETKLEKQQSQ